MKIGNYKSYFSLVVIIALGVAFIVSANSALIFKLQSPMANIPDSDAKVPTVSIVLYEGETNPELSNRKIGFGFSPDNLTSPGPTLRFKIGDIANITVVNVGTQPHAFAVMTSPLTEATVLYNAEIGSANDPLKPGQSGSTILGPIETGNLFYTSPLPGNAEAGLWGAIIVTGQDSGSMGM